MTYIDRALPFSLRSAPKLFSAVADGLAWALQCEGIINCVHYLDFFFWGPQHHWHALQHWIPQLGYAQHSAFLLPPKKTFNFCSLQYFPQYNISLRNSPDYGSTQLPVAITTVQMSVVLSGARSTLSDQPTFSQVIILTPTVHVQLGSGPYSAAAPRFLGHVLIMPLPMLHPPLPSLITECTPMHSLSHQSQGAVVISPASTPIPAKLVNKILLGANCCRTT